MRFTSDEAFEASESGDPIIINHATAKRICADHGVNIDDGDGFTNEVPKVGDGYDAKFVLLWLGY